MTLDHARLLEMYKTMVVIRHAEETLIRLFAGNRMPGFIHSYIGEEATAVGVCSALRDDDYITSTHRGHGHILAKGGDLRRFFAELYGKETGYCRGKGGSMHVADLDIGIMGANGIVGGGIPIAAGAALAAKMQGLDRVAVSFLGDGATNTGSFHEALNLAAVWGVPAIFVCENNHYADFISVEKHTKIAQLSDRAAGYGVPGVRVDGNDVEAVHDVAVQAVQRARENAGPTFIECVTYRWRGHYEGDPQPYRSDEEVEDWKTRDPLLLAERRLREEGLLPEEERESIWADATRAVAEAVEYAEASPTPAPEEALKGLYTDLVEEGWR